MSMSIHTCRTYQVEYGFQVVNGYSEIDRFIEWLRSKQREDVGGIWISENEDDIEIDFDTLEQLKDDETWGEVIKEIISDSDHGNGYAKLSIF